MNTLQVEVLHGGSPAVKTIVVVNGPEKVVLNSVEYAFGSSRSWHVGGSRQLAGSELAPNSRFKFVASKSLAESPALKVRIRYTDEGGDAQEEVHPLYL